MSRILRSVLPATSNHVKPSVVDPELAREKMEQKQATQKALLTRELKHLANGEEVHIQTVGELEACHSSGSTEYPEVLHCAAPKMEASIAGTGATHNY